MKRLAPVIIVLVLIGALAYVNRGISKTAPPDHDDDAPPPAAKATPSPAAKTSPPSGADTLLQPEMTAGDWTAAKHKITVGWVYDDVNQHDPKALTDALGAVQQFVTERHGAVAAEIVDLDVPTADRSPVAQTIVNLGVQVDGRAVGPSGNPGESGVTAEALTQALRQAAP